MSAGTLRRAATLMRERAEAATEGPWTRGDIDRFAEGPFTVDYADVEPNVCGGIDPADAEHIASWHPAVALAVADWLWETANLIEVHAGTECAEPCLHPTCRVIDRALAVARAYLGEAS